MTTSLYPKVRDELARPQSLGPSYLFSSPSLASALCSLVENDACPWPSDQSTELTLNSDGPEDHQRDPTFLWRGKLLQGSEGRAHRVLR